MPGDQSCPPTRVGKVSNRPSVLPSIPRQSSARMQLVGIIPESGEVLTHYHHMFNKTDTSCSQIKMGTVAYVGGDHHMFNKAIGSLTKQTRHVTGQLGYGGVPGTRCCGHIFMYRKYHVKHTSKQCNLDRLKSGSKRDTNETPTCAVPMHAPQTNALWWGEERGTTKGFCILCQGVWGLGTHTDTYMPSTHGYIHAHIHKSTKQT